MDDLRRFCCRNPECPDHGQRGGDNLRIAFRYGPDQQRLCLACRTCQFRFSDRQGTPLFDCRLPQHKAIEVLKHLAESCGIRKTSRLTGVSTNAVTRLARLAGEHAAQLHDEAEGKWQPRAPAMVAGLADHVWTMEEWLTFPDVQRSQTTADGVGVT